MSQKPTDTKLSVLTKLGAFAQKLWRGFQRDFTGQSNRIIIPTIFDAGGVAVPGETTTPNPNNRLEFETARAVVSGSLGDIHRVRCLDGMIGKLMAPFNAQAAVPDAVVEKIALHVADVAAAFKRVSLYADDAKTAAVSELTYVNTYVDATGAEKKQVVARIKL